MVVDRFAGEHRTGCRCGSPRCAEKLRLLDAELDTPAMVNAQGDGGPGIELVASADVCRRCSFFKRKDGVSGVCWHPSNEGAPKLLDESCRFFEVKAVIVDRSADAR